MFFLLTTAAGSALWVVKLEEQKRLNAEALARGVYAPEAVPEQVDEEAPPAYTDDPL